MAGTPPADGAQALQPSVSARLPDGGAAASGIAGANPVTPERIASQTDILRALLAVDMPKVARAISREELAVLTAAFGPPTEDRDILASWLMRGGLTTATNQGLSGVYNPLADAWLVLGWRNIGGSPRLVWAALLEGGALRPAGQPDWLEGTGTLSDELQRVRQQSFASLAAIPDGIGTDGLVELTAKFRGAEGRLVLDRARAMVGALAGWSRGNAKMLERVRKEIGKCNCAALSALDGKTRETLAPTALLTGPQGEILVLQSPLSPVDAVLVQVNGRKPEFSRLDLSSDAAGSAGQ